MINEKEVQRIKNKYPSGTRIKLNYMVDEQAVPSGTLGIVDFVDDAGQIQVTWDNGRSLALIENIDSFTIIRKEEIKDTSKECHFQFDTYESIEKIREIKDNAINLSYRDYYEIATFFDEERKYESQLVIKDGKFGLQYMDHSSKNDSYNLDFEECSLNLTNEMTLLQSMKINLDKHFNQNLKYNNTINNNEKIVLKLGTYCLIVNKNEVPFFNELEKTNKGIIHNDIAYSIYQPPSLAIASKIDLLFNEKFRNSHTSFVFIENIEEDMKI